LNDEKYEEFLLTAKEQERIAEEEAIEAGRIAREKEEEEERKKIKEWADKNKETLAKITPLEFVKFANFHNQCWDRKPERDSYPLVICYEINNFTGFEVTWEVKFKNGYTHVYPKSTIITSYNTIYDFHLDDKTLIDLEYSNSLKDHVDEVNIYVTGINTKYNENNNLLASEIRALSDMPLDVLKYNYYEALGIKYQIYPSP
jgi:hypothetical protein